MKLSINTETKRFTIKLPDTECDELFSQLLFSALHSGPVQKEIKTALFNGAKPVVSVQHEDPIVPPKIKLAEPVQLEPVSQIRFVAPPAPVRTGFRGFLYIKCPQCGAIKGFSAKIPITSYHCTSCGENSELPTELIDLDVKCECGGDFHYKTNITDKMFDIPCLDCGAPVSVEYIEKLDKYLTIWREEK